ncbi:hypothetical protein, partial [Aureimonas ureilytica]
MTSAFLAHLGVPLDDPNWFLRELARHLPDDMPTEVDPARETVLPVHGGALARIRFTEGRA